MIHITSIYTQYFRRGRHAVTNPRCATYGVSLESVEKIIIYDIILNYLSEKYDHKSGLICGWQYNLENMFIFMLIFLLRKIAVRCSCKLNLMNFFIQIHENLPRVPWNISLDGSDGHRQQFGRQFIGQSVVWQANSLTGKQSWKPCAKYRASCTFFQLWQ